MLKFRFYNFRYYVHWKATKCINPKNLRKDGLSATTEVRFKKQKYNYLRYKFLLFIIIITRNRYLFEILLSSENSNHEDSCVWKMAPFNCAAIILINFTTNYFFHLGKSYPCTKSTTEMTVKHLVKVTNIFISTSSKNYFNILISYAFFAANQLWTVWTGISMQL